MESYLAGSRSISTYLAAFQIDEGDVLRLYIGLAAHGGHTHHPTRRYPGRNVSSVSVHVLSCPELLPGTNDPLFESMNVWDVIIPQAVAVLWPSSIAFAKAC